MSNVKVSNRSTTSITLRWNQPFGHRSDYTYRVVLRDNPLPKVTADEFIVFMNLEPGTEYTFSVFTLVAENTSSDPVNISTATGKNSLIWTLLQWELFPEQEFP